MKRKPVLVHAGDDALGARVSDRVTQFAGSWTFIMLFAVILAAWMLLNSLPLFLPHFDPAPFIGLNLGLSFTAAFQAPFILMSQNRAAAKDRLRDDQEADEVAALFVAHAQLSAINEQQLAILKRLDGVGPSTDAVTQEGSSRP